MEILHILVVLQVSFAQILKAALQNITLSDLYSEQGYASLTVCEISLTLPQKCIIPIYTIEIKGDENRLSFSMPQRLFFQTQMPAG